MILIHETFDFHFLLPDAVGFIAVNFGIANSPTLQPDFGNAFKLPLPARSILFTNPHDISNSSTYSHRLDICDFANYLKMHINFYQAPYSVSTR